MYNYDKDINILIGNLAKDNKNIVHFEEILKIKIDKLRDDFNFNFITSFLATIILSSGVILFLKVHDERNMIEQSIKSIELRVSAEKNDQDIKIDKMVENLKINNLTIENQPLDILYNLLKFQILSNVLHNIKDNGKEKDGVCIEISNAMESLIKNIKNGNRLVIAKFEIEKLINSLPECDKYNKTKSDLLKLVQLHSFHRRKY